VSGLLVIKTAKSLSEDYELATPQVAMGVLVDGQIDQFDAVERRLRRIYRSIDDPITNTCRSFQAALTTA